MRWWRRLKAVDGGEYGSEESREELTRNLSAECSAFLEGSYVERLGANGRRVPPWAWLSQLCHCSEAELVDLSRTEVFGREQRIDSIAWQAAVAYLAEEVLLSAARQGVTARSLQQHVLVPLELDLSRGTRVWPLRPVEMVHAVLEVLEGKARRSPDWGVPRRLPAGPMGK